MLGRCKHDDLRWWYKKLIGMTPAASENGEQNDDQRPSGEDKEVQVQAQQQDTPKNCEMTEARL